MTPRTKFYAATGAATLMLTGCAIDDTAEVQSEEGAQVVTVGTLRSQPHLFHPHFYADYAPDGVEFEVVLFDTSPDIASAVVSGSIDFGVSGVPSGISGAAAGQDVVVVAAAADGGSGFVGREGIESVEDLEGLNVGYPMGASQEILLRLTLEDAGMDADSDVELVNLPFADMAGALESEQIDAFLSAELGPSTAIEDGAVEVASPYETPIGRVNIGLLTTNALAEQDPDLVQSVVDVHAEATEFMEDNPEVWAEETVETFGLDPDVVETAIDNIWPRWQLDTEYTEQVEALTTHMAELDQIETEPDVDDVIDPAFAGE